MILNTAHIQFAKKDAPPVEYEGDTIHDALDAATLEELDEFEVSQHTDNGYDHCL
jgi:hypothetical protein